MKKFYVLTAAAILAMGTSTYASDKCMPGCTKISPVQKEINICSDIDINKISDTYNNIRTIIDKVQSGEINRNTLIMEIIKQSCRDRCDNTTECTTTKKPFAEPTTEETTQRITENQILLTLCF